MKCINSGPGGGGAKGPCPASPVKISHKKDDCRIRPHRYHISPPPSTRLLDPLLCIKAEKITMQWRSHDFQDGDPLPSWIRQCQGAHSLTPCEGDRPTDKYMHVCDYLVLIDVQFLISVEDVLVREGILCQSYGHLVSLSVKKYLY